MWDFSAVQGGVWSEISCYCRYLKSNSDTGQYSQCCSSDQNLSYRHQRKLNTAFYCIAMQAIWCAKFCNMTKSEGGGQRHSRQKETERGESQTGGSGVVPVSSAYCRNTSAGRGPSIMNTSMIPLSENQCVSTCGISSPFTRSTSFENMVCITTHILTSYTSGAYTSVPSVNCNCNWNRKITEQ